MTEVEFRSALTKTIEKGLNIIQRNRVPSLASINGVMPAAYLPDLADTSKQDTYLNGNGAKAVSDLIKRIVEMKHPIEKISLGQLHGQSFIKSVLDEIVPQISPDIKWAVDTFAGLTKDVWDVFIAIENIVVKQTVDFGLCKIHPPMLLQVAAMSTEFRSEHGGLLDHHFIELEVLAPNYQAAHLKAREWAWTVFAFIHTPHVTMVTAKGPETLPTFICFNKTVNQWFPPEWKIPHRMIEFDLSKKFDLPRISAMKNRLQKWQVILQSNDQLSGVLEQAAVLIQMCKIATDESTKLLLLTGAMDAMLMERFYPSKQGKEFNRRIGILIPHLRKWGFNSDISFLTKIYKLRSEIVHNGHRHLLNHFDLHTLEAVAVVLLNMLTDSGATNHIDALNTLTMIEYREELSCPQKIKSWLTSWKR